MTVDELTHMPAPTSSGDPAVGMGRDVIRAALGRVAALSAQFARLNPVFATEVVSRSRVRGATDAPALRVLFVTHSFPPKGRPLANVGGMQRVATELHTALAQHPRVRLSTLALRSSARWYEVLTVPFLLRLAAGLPRRIRRDEAHVVLFSSIVTAAVAPIVLGRLPPARLAAIVHGKDVTLDLAVHQRGVLPRVFRGMDALLPVSSATADACIARGADPARIHVVPNGIDAGRFSDLPPRVEARAELEASISLPDGALLLVAVGRQVRRKGTAWFVQHVMPRLPTDVHLAVAGEGPEDEAIRTAAGDAGVVSRVHPLGRVSEHQLRALLVGGDLFVMPNIPVAGDMEGFGVVMLEAGLAGLPTVASDLEGIRDVITEGVNGHLFPPMDAGAFADCIHRYDNDRRALAALSASARAHVESNFTWPAVADRYVEVLERLVSGSSSETSA